MGGVAVRPALQRLRSLDAKANTFRELGELGEHPLGRESLKLAHDVGQVRPLGLADVEHRHQLEAANLSGLFTLGRVVPLVGHRGEDP